MDYQVWKEEIPAFKEKTEEFYAGEVKVPAYKGFSGFYGSYAQKGAKASMLRLRMSAGIITKEKLGYIVKCIKEYGAPRAHITTCQAIQLHDLTKEQVYTMMEDALNYDILTMGGGGDYPRNVMCSPLSGVEQGEYFDVTPYALAAADYLVGYIKAEKMPRKLKVCFSNSPKNVPHATFRDLGFVATPEGKFDVYSAGGLGNNPRFGVKVAEAVDPEDICYYIRAMWLTFRAYGNYENRGKARTRYMVEACGGEEAYAKAYNEKLQEVLNEDLKISVTPKEITKKGDGTIEGQFIIPQKQEGLYAVEYHPIGGQPNLDVLCALNDAVQEMDDVELRIQPTEGLYIINLTAKEAEKVMDIIKDDTARSVFETSVACIGASTCQVGLRDSQALLNACVKATREANVKADALPQIHISGCPSSCGTHQIGIIGFRGGIKMVDKKPLPAFLLFVRGNDAQGNETMGKQLGAVEIDKIPSFIVDLAKAVEASGTSFDEWNKANPEGIETIAQPYIA